LQVIQSNYTKWIYYYKCYICTSTFFFSYACHEP